MEEAKRFKWEKDAQFIIHGDDFGKILTAVRRTLSTPEAQNILMLARASEALEASLTEAIAAGVAVEDKKEAS